MFQLRSLQAALVEPLMGKQSIWREPWHSARSTAFGRNFPVPAMPDTGRLAPVGRAIAMP